MVSSLWIISRFSSSPLGPCIGTLIFIFVACSVIIWACVIISNGTFDVTSTDKGRGFTNSAILLKFTSISLNSPTIPAFLKMVGLVVTPLIIPICMYIHISFISAESKKMAISKQPHYYPIHLLHHVDPILEQCDGREQTDLQSL